MMRFDRMTLDRQAKELGYVRDTFEKVCRLVGVLDFIQGDPLLSEKLALKGGTAINLTIFDLPRLSVDIDMDFTENLTKEETLAMRKQISERIKKYMASGDYKLSQRSKYYHALDSFIYEYQNAAGMKDNIKIEINYINRCHVMPTAKRQINSTWLNKNLSILSVDPLEIYGSKIVALMRRAAPRDLYDVYLMFQNELFDETEYTLLKKCAMFYSAIGSDAVPERFNFERFSSISQQQIKTGLIPVLHKGAWFDVNQALEKVNAELKNILIPIEKEELFWTNFRNKKYTPELLFEDKDILERIKKHPMALWKCDNN